MVPGFDPAILKVVMKMTEVAASAVVQMKADAERLAEAYVSQHQPEPMCSYYFERRHYFVAMGMDSKGLLTRANDGRDLIGGQLYLCACGGARIGPDPDAPTEPPAECVVDPRKFP
jgi:hypothetical protein